jgi:hypothetical protein
VIARVRNAVHGLACSWLRTGGGRWSAAALLLLLCWCERGLAAALPTAGQTPTVVVVVGAAGESEFATNFLRQAELWEQTCARAGCKEVTLGPGPAGPTNDLDRLQQTLAAEPKEGLGPLWIVLVGHGTFDGKEARFNLRGPDLCASDLGPWLQPFKRPVAVINTAAGSAPFISKLSGTNRVIVTATRSGHEQNFARFGRFFAQAIADPTADLDKDGQVSLLEAFLMASRQVGEFYKVEGRLATEHALLDDNGDGLGTPADWFRGVRAVKKTKDTGLVDGLLARQFVLVPSEADRHLPADQRARRDELERSVLLLREKKAQLPEEAYYRDLEKLLLELARMRQSNAPAAQAESAPK